MGSITFNSKQEIDYLGCILSTFHFNKPFSEGKKKTDWSAGLPVVDKLSEELSIHYEPIDQTVWIARKEVLAVYGVLSRLKIAYII